jgi:adenosylcobyric acid synthase
VRFAVAPADLAGSDVVVLPGSKHVAADLAWLRARGLDRALVEAARAGRFRILGVCGGAMLLGGVISDPEGVEGSATGLGLLPFETVMHPIKLTRPTTVTFRRLPPAWASLEGLTVTGYEIRNGRLTSGGPSVSGDDRVQICAQDNMLATTVHGLLEDPAVLAALFGTVPATGLDETFEALADAVDEHLDTQFLSRLVFAR